ncbi:hypothetical protein B0G76_8659 [Paraburkholderia sp. BL23I1N1]|nr:hypothetical protein B0G76_8659 [Paraburkholderia sp. BL23I1N1]
MPGVTRTKAWALSYAKGELVDAGRARYGPPVEGHLSTAIRRLEAALDLVDRESEDAFSVAMRDVNLSLATLSFFCDDEYLDERRRDALDALANAGIDVTQC